MIMRDAQKDTEYQANRKTDNFDVEPARSDDKMRRIYDLVENLDVLLKQADDCKPTQNQFIDALR